MGNIHSYNYNTRDGEDEEANLEKLKNSLGSLTRRQQEEYERCETNNERNIYLRAILSEKNRVVYEEVNNEELLKIRKGLTRRQKREYENYRTDQEKLAYLKAVYSERKRGDVYTLIFFTILNILAFGSTIILNKKCVECEITKYSVALFNGIIYILQAFQETIVTARDGYYNNKSLWFRFISLVLILFVEFLPLSLDFTGSHLESQLGYCQLG